MKIVNKTATFMGMYGEKDLIKAKAATQFVGWGAKGSSTDRYRKLLPRELVNTGVYTAADRVFISLNGNRPNRIGLPDPRIVEMLVAIKTAGATIIADTWHDRERDFNIGERELYQVLTTNGFVEIYDGWYQVPIPKVWNIRDKDRPKDSTYIGRARKNETPNRMGNWILEADGYTHQQCVDLHKQGCLQSSSYLQEVRSLLKGKHIHCFCKPRTCHGDILLLIANCTDAEFAVLIAEAKKYESMQK